MEFRLMYPDEIFDKQVAEGIKIYDLRPVEEYHKAHWPGAISYPYSNEPSWKKVFPLNREFILYCQYGGTSMQALRQLGEAYWAYTVVGGYEAMKKIQERYLKNGWNMRQ